MTNDEERIPHFEAMDNKARCSIYSGIKPSAAVIGEVPDNVSSNKHLEVPATNSSRFAGIANGLSIGHFACES